jgi:hypothetical protein
LKRPSFKPNLVTYKLKPISLGQGKPVDRIADRYMTNVDDIQQVVEKTLQPKSVSGRLSFYGLLSTGDQSVAARGIV